MLLLFFATLACSQDPPDLPRLEPGQEVVGQLAPTAGAVHTPRLDSRTKGEITRGRDYAIRLQEGGSFRIELESYAFDAYLILRDGSGKLLTEDDDGLVGTHARVAGNFQADKDYLLSVCSLFGKSGGFRLRMVAGKPRPLSHARQMQAIEEDEKKGIQYAVDTFGERSLEVASRWNRLGNHFLDTMKNEQARGAFAACLDIREELLGPAHRHIVIALNNLGRTLTELKQIEEAHAVQMRGLQMSKEVCGEDDYLTGIALSNLANILQHLGRRVDAVDLHERALQISELNNAPDSADTARSLNNLALALVAVGENQRAKPLMERAYAIYLKAMGSEHPESILMCFNLAELLLTRGMTEEAWPLVESGLEVSERVFGSVHPVTATGTRLMGRLHGMAGNFEQARPFLQRCMDVNNMLYGPGHPDTTLALATMGSLLLELRDAEGAERIHQRVYDIFRNSPNPSQEGLAMAIMNLGVAKAMGGKLQEALPLKREAVAIGREWLGEDHPTTMVFLEYLAQLEEELGETTAARLSYESALASSLRYADAELPTMSEAERLRWLSSNPKPGSYLRMVMLDPDAGLQRAMELCLQWKGKATRLQIAGQILAREDSSEDTYSVRRELQQVAKQISDLVFQPAAAGAEQEQLRARLDELRGRRLDLEEQLNRLLDLDSVLTTPDLATLQAALPDDAVLLDFHVGKEVHAWVLGPEGPPQLVSLGSAEALRESVADHLGRMMRGVPLLAAGSPIRGGRDTDTAADPATQASAVTVSKLLWQPLAPLIGDAQTVILSPDSFLGELPFGTLASADGTFLLESFRFHYLSDLTRLVVVDESPAIGDRQGPILAVGDVNYFDRGVAAVHPSDQDSEVVPTEPESLPDRNKESLRARNGKRWYSLPATRQEMQSLSDLHQHVLKWKTPFLSLSGAEASEERVAEAMVGQRYIHLATHGYFEPEDLPSLAADAERRRMAGYQGKPQEAVGLLPGLLSGLVFAGANAEDDARFDDGYMSAEEIQHLDLSQCELAVLSACETALGSPRAGEGLMSLRRAFAIAGAKSVLSSLWKVDDAATATLMSHFYQNLWEQGMSKAEALHQAKLQLLLHNRTQYLGDARPNTWGPFVLSGDWR